MNRPIPARAIDTLERAREQVSHLRRGLAENWLAHEYATRLYGGWTREDGEIALPHYKSIEFHEACKMLFCPKCWAYVGQAPKDEDTSFHCRTCAHDIPFRKCAMYTVCDLNGGHQASKTHTAVSEYAAWMIGRRPWDDSLTAPKGSGRSFGIAAMSFTAAFEDVICPYLEERLGHLIAPGGVVKNANKTISQYKLTTGDRIRCYSYEQYNKAGKNEGAANVFQQAMHYSFLWDEVPPPGARSATQRGLVRSRSAGWGREVICATMVYAPQLKEQVYDRAWNKGGDQRHIFAMDMSCFDNPSLTKQAIDEIAEQYPPEELEARLHGKPLHLAGRIFSAFDSDIHVMDEDAWDPLVTDEAQEKIRFGTDDDTERYADIDPIHDTNDWPVILSCDPHHVKPWVFTATLISDVGNVVIREWPDGRTQPYERMRNSSRMGFDDYAAVLRELAASIPGGRDRILWWEMDPAFAEARGTASKGESIKRAMRDRGFFFRADVPRDILAGHTAIASQLRWDPKEPPSELNRPNLFVLERCRNMIWSFHHYTRESPKDSVSNIPEKPKEQGKDFMDTLRYALMRRPRSMSWKNRGDWYQRQKAVVESARMRSKL